MVRLGQVLSDSGVLTESQVRLILDEQQRTGEPFGLLCERMFQIDPASVEEAWAAQYAMLTRQVDPSNEVVEPRALALVTRRQAWQFRVLPIRFDGDELMVATTQRHLRRALRFSSNVIGVPVFLVLSTADALGAALCKHYSLPGMTARSVNDEGMDMLLGERGLRLA